MRALIPQPGMKAAVRKLNLDLLAGAVPGQGVNYRLEMSRKLQVRIEPLFHWSAPGQPPGQSLVSPWSAKVLALGLSVRWFGCRTEVL